MDRDQILAAKAAAKEKIKQLEMENATLHEDFYKLAAQEKEMQQKIKLTQERIALLKARNHLTNLQSQAAVALSDEMTALAKNLSHEFDSKASELKAEEFTINPESKKLEPVINSDARKIMTKMLDAPNSPGATRDILEWVSQYSGHERFAVLLDFYEDLVQKSRALAESFDLSKDAGMLSNGDQSNSGKQVVVELLQNEIDRLTLEQCHLILQDREVLSEIKRLERRLTGLKSSLPEEKVAMAMAAGQKVQITDLKSEMRQLVMQNRQEKCSQLEKAQLLTKIQNFHGDMVKLKSSIVEIIKTMNASSTMTMNAHQAAQNLIKQSDYEFESLDQLPALLRTQLKFVMENPISSLNDTNLESKSEDSTVSSNSLALKSRLRFLELQVSLAEDLKKSATSELPPDLAANCQILEGYNSRLASQCSELEAILAKDEISKTIAQRLQDCKENAVEQLLIKDEKSEVADMNLKQWLEEWKPFSSVHKFELPK